ncbi:MAG: phosphoglucosamine mutase [Legionellales bacterium]|nr:phosphoglucosamine mutase [Legionellales bacterium]|tara:strand:+ start:1097 stop:2455 length:1359 start_codon:yes stop_codon:yes gene_type:complete
MAIFGTDGIRGKVGDCEYIQPKFLVQLGWAIGQYINTLPSTQSKANSGIRPKVLVGKDTRISGYMVESSLESGLIAAGIDIYLLGPMPTPAISYLTQTFQADLSIVISASHNPFSDNGIKLINAKGGKLSREAESVIEQHIHKPLKTVDSYLLGKAHRLKGAPERYIEFCKSQYDKRVDLRLTKSVIDCANGSSYHIAPNVFSELGMCCETINNKPNGLNINLNCGSTSPQQCQAAVLNFQADIGICLDGDGDRLILVDHEGNVLTGDHILYILAMYLKKTGRLKGGVVGSQMANLGLENAFLKQGIPFKRVPVGDKHILAALEATGWNLGGEPSGHIICSDHQRSGDGIITALLIIEAMNFFNQPLATLVKDLEFYPSQLVNLPCNKRQEPLFNQSLIDTIENQYENNVRILIRYSGTEPLLRVLVEAETDKLVNDVMREVLSLVKESMPT